MKRLKERCTMQTGWRIFALLPALLPTGMPAAGAPPLSTEVKPMTMMLNSPEFSQNGAIPKRHTCEGEDVSPDLAWSGLPPATSSLALIVDDPDVPDPAAPQTTWVHWVLYNIPPQAGGLKAAIPAAKLPAGTREGLNDWNRTGYGGPCPPIGRHRYFHKLYALDIVLPDLGKPTKAKLEKAMAGHIISSTELIGTYQKGH